MSGSTVTTTTPAATIKKISDAPAYPSDSLSATAITTVTADSTWKLLGSASVYLAGYAEGAGPRAALDEWYKKEQASMANNNMLATTSVSSWSIVVDLTWKADFREVRKINTSDDSLTPDTANLSNGNFQTVGSLGDQLGAVIQVKKGTYIQPAIRVARTVTTQGTITPSSVVQVSSV